jgi:hypothetical protein
VFRQNLDTINRLLKSADPTGAYALGLVSALAEQDGVTAPDTLLEAAAKCQTAAAADDLYKTCAELRRAGK